MSEPTNDLPLPEGIRSRIVDNGNGLAMHVLEAGFETPERRCIVLLHGFPELAFSWRKIMPALANAGYHVLAPDQRGYGRTTGAELSYEADLHAYAMPNLVSDVIGLLNAFGYREAAAVIGHDFGSPVAAWCALIRPDVFASVVLMSAPFGGPPSFAVDPALIALRQAVHELASLDPPRKHYQEYFSNAQANDDMVNAPQGMASFLRAYFHMKSADWAGNQPHPLAALSAQELASLPEYYIMQADRTMPQTVADHMPDMDADTWLANDELAVYADEFGRTGFQGGLNWYRCATSKYFTDAMRLYAGRTIDVPACFIAGASDWGVHQRPGDYDAMRLTACTNFRASHLIEGAGHWVQQEQPQTVASRILRFLRQDALDLVL